LLVLGCVVDFFFQAEDGIRDATVTGVQTCALPILGSTKIVAVPVAPWNVAAIFVEPTPAPVTSPVASTVATPGFWVAQLTVPVVGAPFQSVIAALSCTVPRIATVGAAGVTVMVTLPNVTTIAWSPVSGVRVIATVAS